MDSRDLTYSRYFLPADPFDPAVDQIHTDTLPVELHAVALAWYAYHTHRQLDAERRWQEAAQRTIRLLRRGAKLTLGKLAQRAGLSLTAMHCLEAGKPIGPDAWPRLAAQVPQLLEIHRQASRDAAQRRRLGAVLEAQRRARHMGRPVLARRCGVSIYYMTAYEEGRLPIPPQVRAQLNAVLRCDLDVLAAEVSHGR